MAMPPIMRRDPSRVTRHTGTMWLSFASDAAWRGRDIRLNLVAYKGSGALVDEFAFDAPSTPDSYAG